MNARPSMALGNITDSGEVEAEVSEIIRQFSPGHDLGCITDTFSLLRTAFDGRLPGYEPLKALYHNRMHTNEVVLCTARMLHGLHLTGKGLDAQYVDAAILGALMHDIGYLMKRSELVPETRQTGAQFTTTHVLRGVDFAREHLTGLSPALLDSVTRVIMVTDHRQHPDWVKFNDPQEQLAAYATATSDLVGQMANREYLERLLYLYLEFNEANMGGFADIHDLLEKTAGFYRMTKSRLDNDLNALTGHLAAHFSVAQGEARNFYVESIDRNLAYLEQLVAESRLHRLEKLKRGGVVEQVLDMPDVALT